MLGAGFCPLCGMAGTPFAPLWACAVPLETAQTNGETAGGTPMHCSEEAHTPRTAPPGIMAGARWPRVTTTLYDVIAALQTVVAPEDDALVVTIAAAWLRSGRLRVPHAVTSTT